MANHAKVTVTGGASGTDTAPPANPAGPPLRRFRSVTDYGTAAALRTALATPAQLSSSFQGIRLAPCVLDGPECARDWDSNVLDPATSRPRRLEEEVQRLLELYAYSLLDTKPEAKFERFTALASRIFDVPICLVSLVDVGRQYFKSNR